MKKVVKKILIPTLLMSGLSFSFIGNNAEAASGVETNMDPTQLSAKTFETKTITIGTNYGGPTTFYFNPGDGSPVKSGNGEYTRKFSYYWTTNSISKYTYSGRVVTQDYGPGPTVYGTATISY
ncbi:hypothetical protein H5P36_15075 [Bacillus sp. APMAM]|nr:hypothetical protein [Bacillus sp. APMAM]